MEFTKDITPIYIIFTTQKICTYISQIYSPRNIYIYYYINLIYSPKPKINLSKTTQPNSYLNFLQSELQFWTLWFIVFLTFGSHKFFIAEKTMWYAILLGFGPLRLRPLGVFVNSSPCALHMRVYWSFYQKQTTRTKIAIYSFIIIQFRVNCIFGPCDLHYIALLVPIL